MGLRAITAPPRGRMPPWPRRSSRRWVRIERRRWPEDMLLDFIPSLPRASLARITERMIDRMDEIDGDPDEANGDELDGSMGEDDFHSQAGDWLGSPGCPVSDPGEDGHDREDTPHD